MAPKAKKGGVAEHVDPEAAKLQEKCNHLKHQALSLGLLGSEAPKPERKLGVSKALAKFNGCDIVKRGSNRKNRYLIILNLQLAPAAAGRLGTLAHLDTKNPVMYLDFPLGRLKLLGTLVFPRAKYVVMRHGVGQVLLEDVFETLLVFSEAHWVGKAEDNPEELPLPCPPELQTSKPHKKYHFNFGAQPKEGDAAGKREKGMEAAVAGDAGASQDMEAAPTATRQANPRRSAAKRSYAEVDEGEEEGDQGAGDTTSEEEQEEEDEEPNATQDMMMTQEPPCPSRHPAASPIDLVSDSDVETAPQRGSADKSKGRAAGRGAGAGAAGKKVAASQEASVAPGSTGRRSTPRRAAGDAASKKLKVIEEVDSDEGDEEDEEEDSSEEEEEDANDNDDDFTL